MRRLGAVPPIDEHQRQRTRPVCRDFLGVTDDRDDRTLEPRVVDGAPEKWERVDLADRGVDEIGLVPDPPRLVLFTAAMMINRKSTVSRSRAAAPR